MKVPSLYIPADSIWKEPPKSREHVSETHETRNEVTLINKFPFCSTFWWTNDRTETSVHKCLARNSEHINTYVSRESAAGSNRFVSPESPVGSDGWLCAFDWPWNRCLLICTGMWVKANTVLSVKLFKISSFFTAPINIAYSESHNVTFKDGYFFTNGILYWDLWLM